MKLEKIKKCIEEMQKEELKKEVAQIRKIKELAGQSWNTTKYFLKDGTAWNFSKITELQAKKSIKKQKEILIKKAIKENNKKFNKKIEYIKELEETEPAKRIEIFVNWSNGSVYGWQARAEARIITKNTSNWYAGQKTGGCGYDKRSTATADALNRSKEIFVIIAEKLEKMAKTKIKKYLTRTASGREFIGYGYDFWGGAVGSFSGGVGFECHRDNLRALGFICSTYHERRQEDFYIFEKKGN